MPEYIISLTAEQHTWLQYRTAQYNANHIPPGEWVEDEQGTLPPPWTLETLVQELVLADLRNTSKQLTSMQQDAAILQALDALVGLAPTHVG